MASAVAEGSSEGLEWEQPAIRGNGENKKKGKSCNTYRSDHWRRIGAFRIARTVVVAVVTAVATAIGTAAVTAAIAFPVTPHSTTRSRPGSRPRSPESCPLSSQGAGRSP